MAPPDRSNQVVPRAPARYRCPLPGKPAHALERNRLTPPGTLARDVRVVARWRVRDSGERCRLSDTELAGRGGEVERARRTDPDGRLPQMHAVQVLLHDLLLGQVR